MAIGFPRYNDYSSHSSREGEEASRFAGVKDRKLY
jgi:hypothetical protein